MPHTKRKARVREVVSSSPVPGLTQSNIPSFFVPTTMINPEDKAALETDLERESVTMAEAISLSPGAPNIPSPPGMGNIDAGGGDTGQSVENIIVNPVTSEITMDILWTAIKSLENAILKLTKTHVEVQRKALEVEKVITTHQVKLDKQEQRLSKVENIQSNLVKSEISNARKLELMENNFRYSNIRLLNFPYLRLISPKDMLKEYFLHVLKIPEQAIPTIAKIYYIFKKSPTREELPEQSIDVSDVLDITLDTVITSREILIVSFTFPQERDTILRLFLRNRLINFHGQQIWIYPDLSRLTQVRRQEFLKLKSATLARGARFLLRYPCKCEIWYKDQKYVYFEVAALQAFLDSHPQSAENG
ncbi:uncharacterized protein LOC115073210 [Rhinatrema bivittatum]|uniref:uncharacterized protein LOC115073210 n=1 Tax=Rhinatrema bivittatum TaxID=194408 RepID=UPI00112D4805|nr:uncharacterized protein LOC115073210 [Rhinatrema bivittatum]